MLLDPLVRDFVVYLEAELGCSPLTASSYRHDLHQLAQFLVSRGVSPEPSEVTTTLVREWVISMHHRGLVSNTVARHLYALRSFWTYLRKVGLVTNDPVSEVSAPRQTRGLPRYLPKDTLQQILNGAQQNRTARCALRNYAMMSMLIFTGMRRGELIGLRLNDVSLAEKTVVVKGKGGKFRAIPLVDEVVSAVADWLEFRPACRHDYLFTTFHGNRIYPSGMQRIWRGILDASGLDPGQATIHTLRHSMATLLLQSGKCSLVEIQQLLGHSRLDTTAIYLHVEGAQLRSAVESHPLTSAVPTRPSGRG